MYNEGISREGELLALGEKFEIVTKKGSSYSYLSAKDAEKKDAEPEKLGRGYDAARKYLQKNKKTAKAILKDIKKALKDA